MACPRVTSDRPVGKCQRRLTHEEAKGRGAAGRVGERTQTQRPKVERERQRQSEDGDSLIIEPAGGTG